MGVIAVIKLQKFPDDLRETEEADCSLSYKGELLGTADCAHVYYLETDIRIDFDGSSLG